MLLRWNDATGDHRPHAASESRESNHRNVEEEEEQESPGDEEMKGARGLPASEEVNTERKGGVEAGREREAGPDDEGEEDEDDGQIGGSLQHVIRTGFISVGRGSAKILRDAIPVCAQAAIALRRDEVLAEVSGPEACDDVDESGKDQQPCGLKVKVAAPAILVWQHIAVSRGNRIARGRYVDDEQRARVYIAGFAPIEARVGDDDLSSGDEQSQEGERSNPVGHADKRGVPGSLRSGR